MRIGSFKLFFLVIPLLCLSMLAQNPPKGSAEQTKQKDSKENLGADQFENVHRNIFTDPGEKARQVGEFTDQASKQIPGDATAMAKMPRKNLVDDYIFGRMERDGIPHAGLSTDEEFLRRVYLDATGLLPTPEKVREFVADKDLNKRDKLIDSLIGSETFAEQWAWFWADFYQLGGLSGNGKDAFMYYTKEWLKVDRPYNQVVTDLLGNSTKSYGLIPQLAFLGRILRDEGLKNRDLTDPDNIAATVNRLDAIDEMNVNVSRIFLGLNIDCISCHDGAGHLDSVNLYLSQKKRDDFARQAAFFGKVRMVGIYNVVADELVMDDEAKGYNTGDDAPFWTEAESRIPRTGKTYEPAFLMTGEHAKEGVNPRAELARMITNHIQFDRATVNLIWGKLMVLGFVEPWDSFDLARIDPKNPPPKPWTIQPTYPELMDALAEDFRANNYSMHHLMKTIMKSNAYQLSSKFPDKWSDKYTSYYARKYLRVMTGAEVVDNVAEATGRPYKFQFSGTEVQRMKQLTYLGDIPAKRGGGAKEGMDIASIMNSFFNTNREAPVPMGNRPTALQAMLMMSTSLVNDRVTAQNGSRVQKILESGKTNEQIVEELYLANLSRWPTAAETKTALQDFEFGKDRKRAVEDLEWALLNGVEFLVNH